MVMMMIVILVYHFYEYLREEVYILLTKIDGVLMLF